MPEYQGGKVTQLQLQRALFGFFPRTSQSPPIYIPILPVRRIAAAIPGFEALEMFDISSV